MSKEIEVYNTYFGDCIILKDKDDGSNLLVDFGIHYFSDVSAKYGERSDLTDKIANDICSRYSDGDISLLITHFHEDHISGLIDMNKSAQCKYKGLFKNIYIANIWNNPFAVASNILEELLLEIEMKKCGLPRTPAKLFDVLYFLCQNLSSVKLLSRGVTFENDKYITLWPADDVHENHISEIIRGLKLPSEFEGKLLALSEIICIFVKRELLGYERFNEPTDRLEYEKLEVRMDENDNSDFNDNNKYEQRIEDMRIIYESLSEDIYINWGEVEQDINVQIRKLNALNHEYNIVFQNIKNGDENILFTGDVEVAQMKIIEKAKDIELHEHFKYIKIPHHGTQRHYFDYSKYTPQNVIITNGRVNTKYSDSYKICKEYGTLNATFLCTNSNNCCNCSGTCSLAMSKCAIGRKIVYSKLFETI